MNHQTPGPIFNRQAPPQFPHSRNLETKMGDRVALVDPKPFWDAGLDGATRHKSNARLLAASYNSFDTAGRTLGVDAAELAESLDLAALIVAARQALAYLETQEAARKLVHSFAPAIMPLRDGLAAIDSR